MEIEKDQPSTRLPAEDQGSGEPRGDSPVDEADERENQVTKPTDTENADVQSSDKNANPSTSKSV